MYGLLAIALVSSRLNYCNSLLYGIADIDLTRLERVQNQVSCSGGKFSSIYSQYFTALLSSLVAKV